MVASKRPRVQHVDLHGGLWPRFCCFLPVTLSLFAGCLDKKRVCDPWARLGFCERRKTFMKKNCPQRCDLCYGETMWVLWSVLV